MTRKALGRGLSALIGEEKRPEHTGLAEIDIDRIAPNPRQPRRVFDDEKLSQLAASMRTTGLLQPIVVRRLGDRFEIVAGERRWRAAALAGLTRIHAVIRQLPDQELLESSLVENIQRENLNPIEEAKAYHGLVSELGLTQEQVAQRVGKERSSVANYLRLLKLPEDVQRLVESGALGMGHARSLLSLATPSEQSLLAKEIVKRGLSVRETERAVARRGTVPTPQSKPPNAVHVGADPNMKAAEERLRRRFSTVVRIVPSSRGGKIEIEFHSGEDLARIFDLLVPRVH